jgi:hypothetical protein
MLHTSVGLLDKSFRSIIRQETTLIEDFSLERSGVKSTTQNESFVGQKIV